jgi:predicted anti-sigma-YlaC factor YlaD
LIAVLVPWTFVIILSGAYSFALWPRVAEGQLLGACLGVFLAIVLVSFIVAAVTFSRDVLSGRWTPPTSAVRSA